MYVWNGPEKIVADHPTSTKRTRTISYSSSSSTFVAQLEERCELDDA